MLVLPWSGAQGFDFNKLIRDGVGYTPLASVAEQATGTLAEAERQVRAQPRNPLSLTRPLQPASTPWHHRASAPAAPGPSSRHPGAWLQAGGALMPGPLPHAWHRASVFLSFLSAAGPHAGRGARRGHARGGAGLGPGAGCFGGGPIRQRGRGRGRRRPRPGHQPAAAGSQGRDRGVATAAGGQRAGAAGEARRALRLCSALVRPSCGGLARSRPLWEVPGGIE
jgi:hypothetical protein